jgi:hypothetical protein
MTGGDMPVCFAASVYEAVLAEGVVVDMPVIELCVDDALITFADELALVVGFEGKDI